MKESGFTLIELLAVMVVLALICLITIPIVRDTIEESRQDTQEKSMQKYVEAVEIAISKYELEEKPKPNKFTTNFENIEKYINYNGSEVICQTKEIYSDGTFYLDGCKVNNSEKEYSYGTQNIISN